VTGTFVDSSESRIWRLAGLIFGIRDVRPSAGHL